MSQTAPSKRSHEGNDKNADTDIPDWKHFCLSYNIKPVLGKCSHEIDDADEPVPKNPCHIHPVKY